jgi:formylglycine-generating enzyme required for sulfatase activity
MKKQIILISLMLGLQGMAGNAQAEERKHGAASEPAAGKVWAEPKTGMKFVWVPSGCFIMGGSSASDKEEQHAFEEQPVHKVCVKGFWMGRYEVTQAQYQQVMNKNPSHFPGSDKPVEQVSWGDALKFAEEMGNSTGTQIRLPSEAEWEYACRAGGAHKMYCGPGVRPDRLAWYIQNSGKQTHAVGQLTPNDWGLYDMSGNVMELTQDCENESYRGAPADGSAWESGNCGSHVTRGGSWTSIPANVRAAVRSDIDSDIPFYIYGFRVVRTLP